MNERHRFKDTHLDSVNGFLGLSAHIALTVVIVLGHVLWAGEWTWILAFLLNIVGGIYWLLMWNC